MSGLVSDFSPFRSSLCAPSPVRVRGEDRTFEGVVIPRLGIPVNLPAPVESTRSLSKSFNSINNGGTGYSVRCASCKTWGKVNPKLHVRGARFVCGACR